MIAGIDSKGRSVTRAKHGASEVGGAVWDPEHHNTQLLLLVPRTLTRCAVQVLQNLWAVAFKQLCILPVLLCH